MKLESPPLKRLKLDSEEPEDEDAYKPEPPPEQNFTGQDVEEDNCSICLQPILDRTIIPACSHEFCFECLLVWTEQSRRCPLCSGQVGDYLIHNIRSKYDFSKHYLAPLRTSPHPEPVSVRISNGRRRVQRQDVRWGRDRRRERERELRAADELERAIEKRRWIYRHDLYAKHVASNSYTRYRPFPTPAQFASNPDLIRRATIFVRRELRVWEALDVEFLTTFTISLMKSIDIRSESAVKLMAEFLDMDTDERVNAEHFAHELYSYLRSPYRDLTRYDAVVQYDTPEDILPPQHRSRTHRWVSSSPSPSGSPSAGPSRVNTRSHSRSRTREPSSVQNNNNGHSMQVCRRSQSRDRTGASRHSPNMQHRTHGDGGMSDQDDIAVDVKGKGRAMDHGSNFHGSTYIIDRRSDATLETSPSRDRSSAEQEDAQVAIKNATNSPVRSDPSMRESHAISVVDGSNLQGLEAQKMRPKVRGQAWQAVHSHLQVQDGSRRGSALMPSDGRRSEIPARPSLIEAGSGSELSIRGAAKAASMDTSASLPPATEPSGEPSGQLTVSPSSTRPEGMSSREIMARTRARLAKLRQEPTLSTMATSERGEHDVAGLDSTPSIVQTHSPIVSGNQVEDGGSRPSSHSVTTHQLDIPSAQSSPSPPQSQADKASATETLRAKLLSKLITERRAHSLQLAPSVTSSGPSIVVAESSKGLLRDSDTLKSEGGQPGVDQLESKLRAQAQLRVKLAAAKRSLVSIENVEGVSLTREEYLRLQLKRNGPQ